VFSVRWVVTNGFRTPSKPGIVEQQWHAILHQKPPALTDWVIRRIEGNVFIGVRDIVCGCLLTTGIDVNLTQRRIHGRRIIPRNEAKSSRTTSRLPGNDQGSFPPEDMLARHARKNECATRNPGRGRSRNRNQSGFEG